MSLDDLRMFFVNIRRGLEARLGERHGLVRSAVTLVGGTAFAQALAVAALPVLTRLYSPEEFNVLAVYASLLGMLSAIACLRFEIAIPLPRQDFPAVNLLMLALGTGLMFSIILAVVIFAFDAEIVKWMRLPSLASYLWMLPVGTAMASAYAATQYWATRRRDFIHIARTRMVQSLGGAGIQIGGGIAGLGSFGLLLGHLISSGAGFLGLAASAQKRDRHLLKRVSVARMRSLVCRYRRFPTYSTLEALTNTAGVQLPIFVIAALAIGPEAGFIMLATKLMAGPMSLVGSSLAQVYITHAPEELRKDQLGIFTGKILQGLIKTGVGPLLFIGIIAGPLSSIVFGDQWIRVGELIAWMTPWFIFKFLSSPVSMVMHVVGRQRLMAALQFAGLLFRLGVIWIAYISTPTFLSEAYAVSGGIFYFVASIIYYRVAGIASLSYKSIFSQFLTTALPWGMLGLLVRWASLALI